MFALDRSRIAQPQRASIDTICADYLDALHRALVSAHTNPRETRLQHERLSLRFARKIKIGEQRRMATGRRDSVRETLDERVTNASF
ncbi:MAG: hypothetical protein GY769_13565 [bacterium]|nr:hypothetical protein [bacterium]